MGDNRESSIWEHLVHCNIVFTVLYTFIYIYGYLFMDIMQIY